jgi:ABC-type oligopeptide transport system ATPase subunit
MRELSSRIGVGFVLISHDLNAVRSIADRIAVMQRGRIVEIGRDIFDAPAHPYTRLLLQARLSTNPREIRARLANLSAAEVTSQKSEPPGFRV